MLHSKVSLGLWILLLRFEKIRLKAVVQYYVISQESALFHKFPIDISLVL